MPFTTADLAAIDAAIASGELTVRGPDGHLVTMRDISELMKARDAILAEIASTTAGPTPRLYPRHQLASFSDD